jgi:hypothetical protein
MRGACCTRKWIRNGIGASGFPLFPEKILVPER